MTKQALLNKMNNGYKSYNSVLSLIALFGLIAIIGFILITVYYTNIWRIAYHDTKFENESEAKQFYEMLKNSDKIQISGMVLSWVGSFILLVFCIISLSKYSYLYRHFRKGASQLFLGAIISLIVLPITVLVLIQFAQNLSTELNKDETLYENETVKKTYILFIFILLVFSLLGPVLGIVGAFSAKKGMIEAINYIDLIYPENSSLINQNSNSLNSSLPINLMATNQNILSSQPTLQQTSSLTSSNPSLVNSNQNDITAELIQKMVKEKLEQELKK